MRRMADMDVIREKKGLLIFSVFLILFSLFLILSPYLWPEESRVVYTSEVTVKKLGHNSGGRYTSGHDYIRTTSGEKYILAGEYNWSQLESLLTEGSVVTITWFKNKPFWTLLAEEMYIGEMRVMTPDTDEGSVWPRVFFASIFMAVGAGGILLVCWHVRRNRRMQEMRDKRIRKKHGSTKK